VTDTDRSLDLLLAELNPVREERLPLPVDSVEAQDLYRHITGSPYSGRAPRRYRRPWLIPGIAAVLVALGFGGEGLFASHPRPLPPAASVRCYTGPSLASRDVLVALDGAAPVPSCEEAWSQGKVGAGPVPALLVACASQPGSVAVFPSAAGADVCGQLGLVPLQAGASSLRATTTTSPPATTVPGSALPPGLQDAVVGQMRSQCMTADVAKATMVALLANAHIAWTVVVGAFPPGRPCASPAFDYAYQRLILVGVPPPSS
jgi:hypothetical protein